MCRLYIRGQPAGAAAEPAPKLETPLDLDALFAEPPADDLGGERGGGERPGKP